MKKDEQWRENMGNSNIRSIEIIVELLKKHNIRYVVVSPGGTNIAFVKAVQNDSFFKLYSVVDERSAMYFAIGLYLQTGEVIATSCTSAQATRNYIPGLTEAFYKHVPILAITMQKHERFVGQDYMQAPNQSSLPVDCVKKSFVMPYVNDINNEYFAIRLANEAILELNHNGVGPVQLCVPWVDFPIGNEVPLTRVIKRYRADNFPDMNFSGKKILIAVGEHRPFTAEEYKAINRFCKCNDCVIYTNHLSNFKSDYSLDLNLAFTSMTLDYFANNYLPDYLITIGGQTGDYPFYLLLSKPELSSVIHLRISVDGNVVDTYDKLSKVFQCEIQDFFNYYSNDKFSSHEYYKKLSMLDLKKKLDIEIPFSNAYAAQQLHDKIPKNSIVQFSILNSLRIWNLFPIDSSIQCYSNVGAFGIDGGMSTFLGQSVVSDNMCFLVIGDLAFFYDMNSLGIRHIRNNVRILLVNNNGGVEFKLDYSDHSSIDQYIAAANHFKNAKGWCETCGFEYLSASSKQEFDDVYMKFLSKNDKPLLLELFVSDNDEYRAYDLIKEHNQNSTFGDSVKKSIKRIIRR